tara:strand:+ start:926 stop:1792 length:867 start_codon:yes stop_codon:yes gene_type:complete
MDIQNPRVKKLRDGLPTTTNLIASVNKKLDIFKRISFVEDTHTYLIDGQISNSPSVTQLIKRFKRPFEKDKVAARVASRTGATVEQIKRAWDINNLYARTLGSMLHTYAEGTYTNQVLAFNGSTEELGHGEKEKIRENFPILVKHFNSFYRNNQHLKCVGNEVALGDMDGTRVCGMCDMIAYNTKTKQLEILDFKTNRQFNKENQFANFLYPFDNLPECEEAEYTVQLNTYKYFIEKHTDLKIRALKIIWLQHANPTWVVYDLKDIQPQIAQMFDCFKAASLFQEQPA